MGMLDLLSPCGSFYREAKQWVQKNSRLHLFKKVRVTSAHGQALLEGIKKRSHFSCTFACANKSNEKRTDLVSLSHAIDQVPSHRPCKMAIKDVSAIHSWPLFFLCFFR